MKPLYICTKYTTIVKILDINYKNAGTGAYAYIPMKK